MAYPELDNLFRELLAANRGPGYGISVVAATPDLSSIDVNLRFLASRTYCCGEPGCHLPRNINRLIKLAASSSIKLPESAVIHWHCFIEEGVFFESVKCIGLSLESRAYTFDATSCGRAVG